MVASNQLDSSIPPADAGSAAHAPVVLFVNDRPWHTRRTVEALVLNTLARRSDLTVFSDAPRSEIQAEGVREVRQYIRQISGFKSVTIIERESNFGLARSIIDGVTSTVNEHGRIVVLEDDLVTSPYFLQAMNEGLSVYEHEKSVASIHGYVYPIDGLPETFFLRDPGCWGWATWKDRWALFEQDGAILLNELKRKHLTRRFDYNGTYPFTRMLARQIAGKNESWAVRWYASMFLRSKLALYPGKALVLNIGADGSGVHCRATNAFGAELATAPVSIDAIPVEENDKARRAIEKYHKEHFTGLAARVRRIIDRTVRQYQ